MTAPQALMRARRFYKGSGTPTSELRGVIERAVAPMRCTEPGRPASGIEHCAACCMLTGYVVGSQEELDLARALDAVLRALHVLDAAADAAEGVIEQHPQF